ncbi:MAG: hypothetical protein EXQ90_04735 [Rhodospirillales bacterium]|nr:hypothetical protein [Rhodospirillales bacterium]
MLLVSDRYRQSTFGAIGLMLTALAPDFAGANEPRPSAVTVELARVGPSGTTTDSFASDATVILRIQRSLAKIGVYKGPLSGRLDAGLQAAIQAYHKRSGLPIDGVATEELATHLETASQVDVLLQRLDKARTQHIDAARDALLANEATRDLVGPDDTEAADPTRDATPCFRDPTPACLLAEASESAKAIDRADMRNWARGELLAAQAKVGFTDQAMSTVRRISDPHLIIVALRDIAEGLARAGRADDALAAAEIIPDPLKKADALAQIALIALKGGDKVAAEKAARALGEIGRSLKEPSRRVQYWSRAASVLERVGQDSEARVLIEWADALARTRVPLDERGAALRYVAMAFIESGRPEIAVKRADEISDAQDRASVMLAVATAFADAGNIPQALAAAKSITEARYKAVVLSHIALAQIKAGQGAEGAQTLAQARAVTEDIKMHFAAAYAVSRVALAQTEFAKTSRASFGEAIELAQFIKDESLRAHVLWTIVAEQRKAGESSAANATEDQARRASTDIRSPLSQIWMYGDFSLSLLAQGEGEAAWAAFRNWLKVAEGLTNAWGRARALSKLAATLSDLPADIARP